MKALTNNQIVAKVAQIRANHYTEAQSKRIHRALKKDSVARLDKAKAAVKAAR